MSCRTLSVKFRLITVTVGVMITYLWCLGLSSGAETLEPVEARSVKSFNLKDIYLKLSGDFILNSIRYWSQRNLLVIFYKDKADNNAQKWALIDPKTGDIVGKGRFPYTRFKEGCPVGDRWLLTLSWKPKIALYLTDVNTRETKLVYQYKPKTRGYSFTLASPLIPAPNGAISYVDLLDEEGYTLSLVFLKIDVMEDFKVKLMEWVRHEDISPARKPLRFISFNYPDSMAFLMNGKVYVYHVSQRELELIRELSSGDKVSVLDLKGDVLVYSTKESKGGKFKLVVRQLDEGRDIEFAGKFIGAQVYPSVKTIVAEAVDNREITFFISRDMGSNFSPIQIGTPIEGASYSYSVTDDAIIVIGKEKIFYIKL